MLVTAAVDFAYTDFEARRRWDLVVDGRAYADAGAPAGSAGSWFWLPFHETHAPHHLTRTIYY